MEHKSQQQAEIHRRGADRAKSRAATYVLVSIALLILYVGVRDTTWQGTIELHTLMEVVATLLAATVGAMALVRYYTRKTSTLLFVGSGFLGTAFLDGYHAVVTSSFFAANFPSGLPSLIPWSWVASRVFLSILLWLSWVAWKREERLGPRGRIGETTVYLGVGLMTLASFLFFAFVPLPRAYYPELLFHRPEEFVPALFFSLALAGYLRKGRWKYETFEHWLVLSLIVGVIGQAVFMSFSGSLFDTMFDAAHLLKKASYILVLTGLMVSTYFLFRRLEDGARALADSEARIRSILDNTVEGIITIDERGIIETFNPAAEKIFGYARDEVVGGNVTVLMPAPYRDEHDGYIGRYLETGEKKIIDIEREVEGRRKDGSVFPVELAVSEIGLEAQRMFVGILRDITERKLNEERLRNARKDLERQVAERTKGLSEEIAVRRRMESAHRESEQRLHAITENLFEGVLVLDTYGHIVFANRSAETLLLGEGGLKLAGRDADDIFLLREGAKATEFAASPFRRVAETGETLRNDDAVFVTNEGKSLNVAYACSPLLENAKRRGAIISFRDIRELKEAQWEAIQASKLASVGQLAGGIAHEINTPIQYIGDNLRFLGKAHGDIATVLAAYETLAEAARETGVLGDTIAAVDKAVEKADLDYLVEELPAATEQSLGGVDQVSRIVLAMKEFSHPGTKEKAAADLNAAIESTLTVCRNEWRHVADVDMDLDAALPPVVCLAGELNQVFLNLIVNGAHAIEASAGEGQGRIRVSTRKDGEWVEIKVADTGNGIPANIRDKIFDPFFTTKEVGRGTGQGLAICRDIVVNKHGGKIFFETEEGKGTTFVIRLPLDGQTKPSGDA